MDDEGRMPVEADREARLEAMEFELCKHLSSLGLLALGGVVTFAGSIFADVADKRTLWIGAGLFGLAAVGALSGLVACVERLRPGAKRPWWRWSPPVRMHLQMAMMCLGMGAGVVVAFAADALR